MIRLDDAMVRHCWLLASSQPAGQVLSPGSPNMNWAYLHPQYLVLGCHEVAGPTVLVERIVLLSLSSPGKFLESKPRVHFLTLWR